MLHIFLAILKVIGIAALVILGIVLILVLLVLFWPVHYDAHLKKENGPFEADGKAGWLGRLVCADFRFAGKHGTVTVKICGKVLRVFHIPGDSGKETEPLRSKRKKASGKVSAQQPGPKGDTDSEGKTDSEGQAKPGKQPEPPEHRKPKEFWRRDAAGAAGGGTDQTFLAKAAAFLLRALEAPSDLTDRADAAADRAEGRLRTLSGTAGPFLTPDALGLYRRLIGYLVHFLHSCRIRRLDGYVLIGTGKPDRTGETVGFLYLVLPEAEGDYSVQADFYQRTFRTDTDLAGHIRLNHAAALAFRVIRDREFRILLSRIRHKDGGADRSGERKKDGRRLRKRKTGRRRKQERHGRAAGGKKAA